jgi:hypothetical protein
MDTKFIQKSAQHLSFIWNLKKLIGWKGTKNELIRRIQRLLKKSSLSCREIVQLKRLIRIQVKQNNARLNAKQAKKEKTISFKTVESLKSADIDYEDLVYHFPGMKAEQLKACFMSLE